MEYVHLLTSTQKDSLLGNKYTDNTYFFPIQDLNGNWVLSQQEVDFCTNKNFEWLKETPIIEYKKMEPDNI